MNKQQASGRMGCRSITVSDTNNYQFSSSLIQPHISFHPFVAIILNKNYKLLLKFWSWIKNYISIEYYRLDKSISVVNIVVVDTPIQWYDIISFPLITTMFYQFSDLLGEYQTLDFPPEPAGAVLICALILMLNWLGSNSKPAWICLFKSRRLIVSSVENVHAVWIS
jgi:hypothetical protein